MRLKITALLLAVVVVSATLGASAYTTGSLTRSSSVDVVSDTNGLIGLTDGTSGDLVYKDGDSLAIDFSTSHATGANSNATFTLGNTSAATTSNAFQITNQDDVARDITVSYSTTDSTADDGTDNLQFQIYNSSGTKVTTASEEAAASSISAASGETFYVVIVVDTNSLTSAADLSGELKVEA